MLQVNDAQAVGPVALVSLLLSDGLTELLPAAEVNTNPNHPADPATQLLYNHAAIQVCYAVLTSLSIEGKHGHQDATSA